MEKMEKIEIKILNLQKVSVDADFLKIQFNRVDVFFFW